jgi:polyisoprenoid-binding protein YceI
MGILVIFSFVLLAVAAIAIQKKQRFQQVNTLHLIFFAALAILLKLDLGNTGESNQLIYALIGVVAINFLASKWNKLRSPIFRIVAPILTFSGFLLFFSGQSFEFLDRTFHMSDKATLVLPFIGIGAMEISLLIQKQLKKVFDTNDSASNVVMVMFLAIALLIGMFNAQGFGVFLVVAGMLAASFFLDGRGKHLIHSLFAVALIGTFAQQYSIDTLDLRVPKILSGLFVGAFALGLIHLVWTIQKRSILALILGYGLSTLMLILLLVFESAINASFGGTEALLGAFMGFAIANSVIGLSSKEPRNDAPIAMSLLSIMIFIAILIPPLLVNEEQQEAEALMEELESSVSEGEEGTEPVTFLSLEEIAGDYSIDETSAIVTFKLGPEGSVTKGAIKEFSGSIKLAEDISKSTFDIKMPVGNVTTFLGMRDKSIMGADYFNEAKFPQLRFKGSELKPTSKENEFEMIGTFEMLGVSKDQAVTVHRIAEGGKKILVGGGEIDRTLFGMADDPREGNVVTFNFKVELNS